MDNTPVDAIQVTQADRDAAAERLSSPFGGSPIEATQDIIRAGKLDAHPWVQAFARHRTTSLAAHDGLVDALRAAQPIVEADYYAAKDTSDSDWIGQSKEALDKIKAALASIEAKQ